MKQIRDTITANGFDANETANGFEVLNAPGEPEVTITRKHSGKIELTIHNLGAIMARDLLGEILEAISE